MGDAAIEAIRFGHLDVALYLLHQGAPRRYFLEDTQHFAIIHGQIDECRKIAREKHFFIGYRYATDMPALNLACKLGYVDIVNVLLQEIEPISSLITHDADINVVEDKLQGHRDAITVALSNA